MYRDKGTTAFPGLLLKRAGNNRKQPERLFKTMIPGFLLSENRGMIVRIVKIVEIVEIVEIAEIVAIMWIVRIAGIAGIVRIAGIVKIVGIVRIAAIIFHNTNNQLN